MVAAKWKDTKHRTIWREMTLKQRFWFLKIKRSRQGVKRAAIHNRIWGALRRHGLVMQVGDWCMLTYPGEELFGWVKKQSTKRRQVAGVSRE